MKQLYTLLFWALTYQALYADFPSIVGEWHVVSEGKSSDEIGFRTNGQYIFHEDGTFYSDGIFVLLFTEDETRILTVSGPESGVWEVKDGKLHLLIKEWSIDFYLSLIPEMDRAAYIKEIEKQIPEPTIMVPISGEDDELVFKDEEDDSLIRMSKIRLSVTESGTGEPFMENFLTGSMDDLGDDPTIKKGGESTNDSFGKRIRRTSKLLLDDDGFNFASSLPTHGMRKGMEGQLRPRDEIISRLLCMFTVSNWVVFSEEENPKKVLDLFIAYYGLSEHMTEAENEILSLDRKEAKDKYYDTIGWRMENMWTLCWVLGLDIMPEVTHGQAGDEIANPMFQFLATAYAGKEAFMKKVKIRDLKEVIQLEDIFYCAHNAVRSAQLGEEGTVPEGFHPIIHGGTTHERRHALTWVLSPGVSWDETDLST